MNWTYNSIISMINWLHLHHLQNPAVEKVKLMFFYKRILKISFQICMEMMKYLKNGINLSTIDLKLNQIKLFSEFTFDVLTIFQHKNLPVYLNDCLLCVTLLLNCQHQDSIDTFHASNNNVCVIINISLFNQY